MNLRAVFPPLAPITVAVTAVAAAWLLSEPPTFDAAYVPPSSVQEVAAKAPPTLSKRSPDMPSLVAAMEARPLLIPGRRVPKQEPVTAPEAVDETLTEPSVIPEAIPEPETPVAPDIHMQGVMILDQKLQVLVRNMSDQSERWFAIGEDIQGWTLVEITQGAMLLRSGDTEVTIAMFQ